MSHVPDRPFLTRFRVRRLPVWFYCVQLLREPVLSPEVQFEQF
jgi:hypothetical protein